MQGLTPKQKNVLDYLKVFIKEHFYAPTLAEIQAHFRFKSINAVSKHLKALQSKGAVQISKKRRRSLVVPLSSEEQALPHKEHPGSNLELPLLGQITAGLPIVTFSTAQSVSIPAFMVSRPELTYALKVHGNNLQDEMLVDGDLLLLEARREAFAGETVIALVNQHETVISRYYPMEESIQLVDRNPNHHPMILRREDVEIQGVVVALFRLYT